MKKLFLILCCNLCVFVFFCNAQKETYNWHFGNNCYVSFVTGSPQFLTGCQIYNSMHQEGCSTISDGSGNVLFYTDGVTVWNSNNTAMPNGTGLFGYFSSSQGALIVPKPGSATQYYIFSLKNQPATNKLRYSIVDMTLAGGLGDLSIKNVLVADSMTEKQIAVRHSNGIDFWLITHRRLSNEFQCYLINASGVAANPVRSNTGLGISTYQSVGCIKATRSGNKIASAYWEDTGHFEVYDFDKSTGIVSNPILLQSPLYEDAYSVEFSPDERFLYGSCFNDRTIYQFDLQSLSPVGVLVGSPANATGDMLLAPDGKIYIVLNNYFYLGVFNAPDSAGAACNFVENGFSLGIDTGSIGLPNMIHDLITLMTPVETILQNTEVFHIFPNPASDEFTIASGQWTIEQIKIFNLPGVEVFHKQLTTDHCQLTTSTFPNGIYIIKAYTDKGVFQQKLVVNH